MDGFQYALVILFVVCFITALVIVLPWFGFILAVFFGMTG